MRPAGRGLLAHMNSRWSRPALLSCPHCSTALTERPPHPLGGSKLTLVPPLLPAAGQMHSRPACQLWQQTARWVSGASASLQLSNNLDWGHRANDRSADPTAICPSPPPLQLVPFTCFALGTLRPAVPLAAPGSPPAVGVPALTRADIRVGRCFELRVSGDRSGQSAAYVPALVVSAGINTKRQRERQRSIAHVLERLHARQAQQAQQPDAAEAGEAAAAGEADAAATAELAYQLAWPGGWQPCWCMCLGGMLGFFPCWPSLLPWPRIALAAGCTHA